MRGRFLSLLIGYLCGSFLTAEAVARKECKKSAFEIGSKNPGMANIMATLGFRAGITVLLGDIGKTGIAALLVFLLYARSGDPRILFLYAGLGVTLGHNFPFWHHFRGGKGVATTCSAIVLGAPLWGMLSNIAGMLVVFKTGYLPVGAVVIPAVYMAVMLVLGRNEAAILGLVFTVLMVRQHWQGLVSVKNGTCRRVMVLQKIAEKWHSR